MLYKVESAYGPVVTRGGVMIFLVQFSKGNDIYWIYLEPRYLDPDLLQQLIEGAQRRQVDKRCLWMPELAYSPKSGDPGVLREIPIETSGGRIRPGVTYHLAEYVHGCGFCSSQWYRRAAA